MKKNKNKNQKREKAKQPCSGRERERERIGGKAVSTKVSGGPDREHVHRQGHPDLKHHSFTFASCFSNSPDQTQAFFLSLTFLLAMMMPWVLCWRSPV